MKDREKIMSDFLDNVAMWTLLIISIPFMLVVMGLSKIYKFLTKNKNEKE